MKRKHSSVRIAVVQYAMIDDRNENLDRACYFIRQAASEGAQIILLPELFEHLYFPKQEDRTYFRLAEKTEHNHAVQTCRRLANDLQVVIPVSYYERSKCNTYNSVSVIDADGHIVGVYRKSHIPDGPGYREKFYFQMGDTGFCAFDTRYARIGIGICWDQWFPECSRVLTLFGADLLLYPSTIGSEPDKPELDTKNAWQKVMVGQAVSNNIPIAASNRIGDENSQIFYGSSFIVDHLGEIRAEMGRTEEGFIIAEIDLDETRRYRKWFGLLSDRRPDLYQELIKNR